MTTAAADATRRGTVSVCGQFHRARVSEPQRSGRARVRDEKLPPLPPNFREPIPITLDLTLDAASVSVGATVEVLPSVAVDIVLRLQIPDFACIESLVVAAPVHLVNRPGIGYEIEKLLDPDRTANAVFVAFDLSPGIHTLTRQWTPVTAPAGVAELEIDWHAKVISKGAPTVVQFGSGLCQPEYLSGWTRGMLIRFSEPNTGVVVVPEQTRGVNATAYPPLNREDVQRQPEVLARWEADVATAYAVAVNAATTSSDSACSLSRSRLVKEFECMLMDDVEWLESYRREQLNVRRLIGTKPSALELIARDPDDQ